ncbi:aprataxin and PNK-like factor [Polyodon spathula]|uniref:aprataxin and PNK-like factor n=1 Tax=Polyodon spathula TaxID=7913 RepID=UPI001B7E69AB|nr:aprataxin and PNK-like factor [Polyodon spathula]
MLMNFCFRLIFVKLVQMSAFQLEPVDGGSLISLTDGETVVGRGPLLGVTDKRVSRNHSLLEVIEDQLRIKPTHFNPCFYQSSIEDTPRPLEKDKWQPLYPGNLFSLLPDKYIFRVISTDSKNNNTQRNSQTLNEETFAIPHIASARGEKQSVSSAEESSVAFKSLAKKEGSNTQENSPFGNHVSLTGAVHPPNVTKPAQKRRVLPAWMLKGASETPGPSASGNGGKGGCKIKQGLSNPSGTPSKRLPSEAEVSPMKKRRKKSDENKQAKLRVASSSAATNKEETAYEEHPGASVHKAVWKLSDDESAESPTVQARPPAEFNDGEMSGNEEEAPSQRQKTQQDSPVQSETSCRETEKLSERQSPETKASGSSGSKDTAQANAGKSQKRNPCMYGKGCYRKNPIHFQEFSHPGDCDYQEDKASDEDESDNRLECPYGTDCYRKNPQHREEYKHTMPPETGVRRSKRKHDLKGKSVLADDSDEDGQSNEYDLEDSFINDEEDFDHTDEDSDYEPESDDSTKEDIADLKKEAKQFVSRRK